MIAPILLDTCALIWIAEDADIADEAVSALDRAADRNEPTYVSPMTAWEIGMLISRGRIAASMAAVALFQHMMAAPNLRLTSLSPEVLVGSSFLPGSPPRDPADRIIVTTARDNGMQVMTRDRAILAYAEAGHVAAIPC